MGDDLKNPSDRFYGNSLLQAKGCDHGTFVAGVIAGQGINNAAITGVWPQARLMIIRAVPDGDEYDKDISTAIRYAVDNGAKVINMSLGKYTSPDADMVNEAIEYALKKTYLSSKRQAITNGISISSPIFLQQRMRKEKYSLIT